MIFVPDISEARQFYTDVMGFEVAAESETHLSFAGAGCEFVAYKCDKPAGVGDYANEARSVLVFEVPNIESALQKLQTHNVTILHSKPSENQNGRYVAFEDPFGIVHEIFEPKVLHSDVS
jgi:catechol 2,3-dioxygenase-like lactoylglutathione lyase family enzyme